MPQEKQDQESMRAQILDSARERFTQYGFGKTTMAEIAKDCRMSAANIYRYFDNKHDIGAAMACRCLSEKALALKQIVDEGELPAAKKIELFVLTNLRFTHEQWSSHPHLSELVDAVTQSRQDIVNQHFAQTRELLKRIIDEGVVNKEFEVDDSTESAEAVLAALFLFDYPNLMGLYPLKVFEEKAVKVAELIVHGLKKC